MRLSRKPGNLVWRVVSSSSASRWDIRDMLGTKLSVLLHLKQIFFLGLSLTVTEINTLYAILKQKPYNFTTNAMAEFLYHPRTHQHHIIEISSEVVMQKVGSSTLLALVHMLCY